MIQQLYTVTNFTTIFYFSLASVVLGIMLNYYGYFSVSEKVKKVIAYFFVFFLIIFIGYRPIGDTGFADSPMYMDWLEKSRNGILITKDIGFGVLVYLSSFFPNRFFFFLCSVLSIGFLVLISKKISKKNWFLFFLGYAATLYFWNHNAFSIRQGLGAVLFIYGLLIKNVKRKYIFFVLAVLIHKSYLLPLFAYIFAVYFSVSISVLLIGWISSILVSYLFGHYFEILFGHIITYFDGRSDYFLSSGEVMQNAKTGFRLDMIAYSLIFVILGFIYSKKRNSDETYLLFYKIFLITNIFFILVIQVSHSYRFAYLSWFLTPLVIYYPILKDDKKIGNIYWQTIVFSLIFILIYIPLKTF